MATNPIQKRTRNSFLLGMLLMLLVALAAMAILYFVFFSKTDLKIKREGGTVQAYRLTSSIKSGESLDGGKLESVVLNADEVPADYIAAGFNLNNQISKLDLQPGTILSKSLIKENDEIKDSTRLMEYNMLTLPSKLSVGDYVDVRLTLPSGEDFIVLTHKEVKSVQNTTVGMYLTEGEILMMSSAIVESYIMTASNLHIVQYVEPGNQKSAKATYSVNDAVNRLIASNSETEFNIEDFTDINEGRKSNLREVIEQELQKYTGSELMNIETGVTEQKKDAMSLYLSGLEGY